MLRALGLSVLFVLLGATAPVPKSEHEISEQKNVPAGMYVYSDNPSCGVDPPDMVALIANKETAGAATVLWGPEAGAVVLLVSVANDFAESCGGGDFCKHARKAKGKEDHSSCATMCVSTPPGARLKGAYASDRDGAASKLIEPKKMSIKGDGWSRNQKDFSGWENVHAAKNSNNQWVVCGTAKNWSGDKKAKKILTAVYE